MTDIVERLRGLRFVHVPAASGLMDEAAAEIERLRTNAEHTTHDEGSVRDEGTVGERLVGRLSITQAMLADNERLRAENARLREAIRRLADQDATLSVCEGNVTVTMDATLTDEEREAIEAADAYMSAAGCRNTNVQATLRGLLERTNHDAVPEAKAGASVSSVPLGKAQASSESAPRGPSASQFSQPADAQGTGNTHTLTDEEREAVEVAIIGGCEMAGTLRNLLERLHT